MRPSNAVRFLQGAIRMRRSVLLVGAPGVGKTDIVTQAAAAEGADLIVSHPVVSDPTDAKGLPWPVADRGEATFLPFGDLARAIKAERPTVWLLDDLGQAAPATQAAYMQLILARRVNGHALSDKVTILACSNRRTDRAGVTGMLEPVKSRFLSIVEIEPSLDDWCVWALNHDLPTALVAFHRFRGGELLCKFAPAADMSQSPVPRTWAHLAEIEAWGLPDSVEAEAMAGAVGEGAATEYLAFRRMVGSLVTADQILLDPSTAALPGEPSACYAVCTALAARANVNNFDRVVTYATRLVDAGKGEFAALTLRDAVRRTNALTATKAYMMAVSGPLGDLITGRIQ